ncbi:hypothetical protein FOZ63_026448, partial [Perkinsus olseni]
AGSRGYDIRPGILEGDDDEYRRDDVTGVLGVVILRSSLLPETWKKPHEKSGKYYRISAELVFMIFHNCFVLLLCLVSYHSATHEWRDWLALQAFYLEIGYEIFDTIYTYKRSSMGCADRYTLESLLALQQFSRNERTAHLLHNLKQGVAICGYELQCYPFGFASQPSVKHVVDNYLQDFQDISELQESMGDNIVWSPEVKAVMSGIFTRHKGPWASRSIGHSGYENNLDYEKFSSRTAAPEP